MSVPSGGGIASCLCLVRFQKFLTDIQTFLNFKLLELFLGECHRAVNGDATETNLAEKRLNSAGADLNSEQVSKATTQVSEHIIIAVQLNGFN